MSLIRTLKLAVPLMVGADVEGWARAAHRYLQDGQLGAFTRQPQLMRRTFGLGKRDLARRCAVRAGIVYNGVGPALEQAMRAAGAFDALADELLEEYAASRQDPALETARDLLAVCRTFDGSYLYGGGHGEHLSSLTVHRDLDCSSSTSLALWRLGLFAHSYAQVSGWYETWASAGRGRYVTVHANDEHVWIEFSLPEGYFRFDTSPHGDGPRGPRVRTLRRGDSTFVHRHPNGL